MNNTKSFGQYYGYQIILFPHKNIGIYYAFVRARDASKLNLDKIMQADLIYI